MVQRRGGGRSRLTQGRYAAPPHAAVHVLGAVSWSLGATGTTRRQFEETADTVRTEIHGGVSLPVNSICKEPKLFRSGTFTSDLACNSPLEALLFFKGSHALEGYRMAHALLGQGRRPLTLHLQNRMA